MITQDISRARQPRIYEANYGLYSLLLGPALKLSSDIIIFSINNFVILHKNILNWFFYAT